MGKERNHKKCHHSDSSSSHHSSKHHKKNRCVNGDLHIKGDLTVCGEIKTDCYDYIIVGLGPAGSVLARKLSDEINGKHPKVLVLERGINAAQVDGKKSANINSAYGASRPELGTMIPWIYRNPIKLSNEAGTTLYGEGLGWGGAGKHNSMNYWRGSRETWKDYDLYTGGDGVSGPWAYDSLLPYMKACENYTVKPDGTFNPAQRGNNGPISVVQATEQVAITNDPISQAFANNPTVGVGFNVDINDGSGIGVGAKQILNKLPLTPIAGTARSWTNDSFLPIQDGVIPDPAVDEEGNGLNGRNLKIESNANVSRVIFEGIKAVGVEYIPDVFNFLQTAKAAFDPLFPLGQPFPLINATIPVVSTSVFPVPAPGTVGRLVINKFIYCSYTGVTTNASGFVTSFTGCNTLVQNATTPFTQEGSIVQNMSIVGETGFLDSCECAKPVTVYGKKIILCASTMNNPLILQRSGIWDAARLEDLQIPLVLHNPNVGQHMSSHIRYNATVNTTVPMNPANQHGQIAWCTDLHGLPAPFNYPADGKRRYNNTPARGAGNSIVCFGFIYHPQSEGTVEITGKNVTDKGNLDCKLYSDPGSATFANGSDLNKSMAYVKTLAKIAADNGWTMVRPTPAQFADDNLLAAEIRTRSGIQVHQSGTCRMGTSIENSVVDRDLNVWGTENLMIADLSVLPWAPDGNPYESTWIVAVRALQTLGVPLDTTNILL